MSLDTTMTVAKMIRNTATKYPQVIAQYKRNKNGEFEFEIKDGKGNIKEYNDKGEIIFEGEYLNGKRESWKRGRI